MGDEDQPATSPASGSQSSPSINNSAKRDGQLNGNVGSLAKGTRAVKLTQDYTPPGARGEELEDDLGDFGFDQGQIKDLVRKREFYFDATMQRPHYQTRKDRENERKQMPNRSSRGRPISSKPTGMITREAQRPVKKMKVSGEGLILGDSNSEFKRPDLRNSLLIYENRLDPLRPKTPRPAAHEIRRGPCFVRKVHALQTWQPPHSGIQSSER